MDLQAAIVGAILSLVGSSDFQIRDRVSFHIRDNADYYALFIKDTSNYSIEAQIRLRSLDFTYENFNIERAYKWFEKNKDNLELPWLDNAVLVGRPSVMSYLNHSKNKAEFQIKDNVKESYPRYSVATALYIFDLMSEGRSEDYIRVQMKILEVEELNFLKVLRPGKHKIGQYIQ